MNCILFGHKNKKLEERIIRIHKECGFTVTCVRKLDQVYDKITSLQPPLVVFTTVDKKVLALVKKLSNAKGSTPVILAILEEPSSIKLDEFIASGFDDIISPPLSTSLLESRLRFVIQRALQRNERNTIESALKTSEDNALAVLNTTVDGIITINKEQVIQSYNRAAEQIFGYTADEVIGQNVNILMPPPYREEHDGYVRSYHETKHKKIIGIGREVRGLRKNGETFPMELAVSEIKQKENRTYIGIVRDISIRRELEIELLQTSEEERRRIGQDIHDGLGQMLTGIGLIAKNLAQNLKTKNREEAEHVFELVGLIKSADEQARAISRTLIPVELEDGGLKAAIIRLNSNIQRLYGLQCVYEETGHIPEISSNINTHFFRIIQEAMGNAAKHSKATLVTISVAGNEEKIRAHIQDNGIGIDLAAANGRGMGLRIMQHRANVIGASLKVRKGSTDGTIVTCTIPLSRQT